MIYEIEGLRQSYNGRTVLAIERLEVRDGEILALVGPSGAGKSTLLRLLNFLESSDRGQHPFWRAADTRAGAVGPAPAGDYRLPAAGSAPRERAEQRGLWTEFARAAADGRVDGVLAEVGLDRLARQPAQTLSGGEMQRVALARALVIEPRVLLLDEPTANLDPYNVSLIEKLIRDHNREHGTTVVMVTHNVFQAKRLAHRTGLMLNGALVELTDTASFFNSPADPRTRAFVQGEMVY